MSGKDEEQAKQDKTDLLHKDKYGSNLDFINTFGTDLDHRNREACFMLNFRTV